MNFVRTKTIFEGTKTVFERTKATFDGMRMKLEGTKITAEGTSRWPDRPGAGRAPARGQSLGRSCSHPQPPVVCWGNGRERGRGRGLSDIMMGGCERARMRQSCLPPVAAPAGRLPGQMERPRDPPSRKEKDR